MDKHLTTIKAYVSAWNEPSEDKINRAVVNHVAQNVRYCDPFTDEVQGVKALVKVMANVSQSFHGVKHELVGEPAVHHEVGYYHWTARLESGKTIPGMDYIEFGPEGRITRVVSFTNAA